MRLPGMLLLLLMIFQTPRGFTQEQILIKHPSWTTEDTGKIIQLINCGISLLQSNLDSAMYLLDSAYKRSKNVGFEDGIGHALSFMGAAACKSNPDLAHTYFSTAFPYCINAKFIKTALPNLYNNMAACFNRNGRMDQANSYYHKALSYYNSTLPGHNNVIGIYANLSALHSAMDNNQISLYYGKIALEMAVMKKLPLFQVPALINIGCVYLSLNNHDSALYYFKSGLSIAKRNRFTDMEQTLLHNIGSVLLDKGNISQAIPYFKDAIELSHATDILMSRITPGYALGKAYQLVHNYKGAEKVLISTLAAAEKSGLWENKHVGHRTLAEVYEFMGKPDKALVQYHLYEVLKDSIFSIEKNKAIKEVETKFQVVQKNKIIAQKELQITLQKSNIDKNRLLMAVVVLASLIVLLGVWILFYNRNIKRKRQHDILLLKAVMAGEEKERDRIAQELHDSVGGMITGLKLKLSALSQKTFYETDEINSIARQVVCIGDEIHKTARNLTHVFWEQDSLWEAIAHYCEQYENSGHINIRIEFMGNIAGIDNTLQLALYRTIQELIQNSAKHGHATEVSIQLRRDQYMLYLSVEDNGKGFNTEQEFTGIGLQNIKTRIESLKGFFTVDSMLGKGTAAFVELNLREIIIS